MALEPKTWLLEWEQRLNSLDSCPRYGRLESANGASLLACLPGGRIGEQVLLGKGQQPAVVVGFSQGRLVLQPLGEQLDLRPGTEVRALGTTPRIPWSENLLGHVLDVRGRSLDGRTLPVPSRFCNLHQRAPAPMLRRPIENRLTTGVKAIDGLCCLGQGQRVGLFAGAGVGKSSLLAQIARSSQADCNIVCLVGERGRELNEFIEKGLGCHGLNRSVVVAATSDEPAGVRAQALPMATALAEGFRQAGKSVLLLVDSITRHARALREIALSAGEPPGRRGFPSSVFDRLAALLERAGNDAKGSITSVYTVLMEDNGEDDPLAEEIRSLLDGHIYLNPDLARAGCYPAVEPCQSLSRLMNDLVEQKHRACADEFRNLWAAFEQRKDLIAAGVYEAGSDPLTDRALAIRPRLMDFLKQDFNESVPFEETCKLLNQLSG
jgi:type III secretion protein N (ATPase)